MNRISPDNVPRRGRPERGGEPTTALFVRLPSSAAARLDRASLELRTPKRDLVADLVTRYLDPDDPTSVDNLRQLRDRPRVVVEQAEPGLAVGRHSFLPAPEAQVLTAGEVAALLRVDEAEVVDLAGRGELPGRRVGDVWRFSRAAVLAWLGEPAATPS